MRTGFGELVRSVGTRLAVLLGRRVDVRGSADMYEQARAAWESREV